MSWTVQVNDLVGGWVVTDYPHPLSEHDHRPENRSEPNFGYVIAECYDEDDARQIAALLNMVANLNPESRRRRQERRIARGNES